jgi:inner membrane protein
MPMSTTHALLPLAVAVAVAKRPIPWTLIIVTMIASAAPDIDGLFKHFLGVPPNSIYGHRGATHSLFLALAAGLAAAAFHKLLGVRPLTAGVCVAAAMASHGILDMMTDSGQPVAYLWPVSSGRLFADWRPIHSGPVHIANLATHVFARFQSELRQLIVPMFVIAFAVRCIRAARHKLNTSAPQPS